MDEIVRKPNQSGNPWLMWGAVVLLIIVLASMALPVVMTSNKKAALAESTSNAKQIFYLLIEFDEDFGQFPSDATATGALAGYRGDYSNDYLAQLIEGGYTRTEEIFYAKGGSGANRKPDNVIDSRKHQLAEGECGFAYVKGLDSKALPETPVLLTPMYGDGDRFNTDVHQGKAAILRLDGSVKQLLLDKKTRQAKIGGGKTLFQVGSGSVWGEEGLDQSRLCFAKKPYRFTPRIMNKIQAGDWFFGTLAILTVFLMIKATIHSRSRSQ